MMSSSHFMFTSPAKFATQTLSNFTGTAYVYEQYPHDQQTEYNLTPAKPISFSLFLCQHSRRVPLLFQLRSFILSTISSVHKDIENTTSNPLSRGLAYTGLNFVPGANTLDPYRGHAFYHAKT